MYAIRSYYELVNLPEYLKDINRSYGSATSALVYGIVLLLVIFKLLISRSSKVKS